MFPVILVVSRVFFFSFLNKTPCGLKFPYWILLSKYMLSVYLSFIYSTRTYLVFVIIRTVLGAEDIVEIKEIPTLTELLVSLQIQRDEMNPVFASLSLEISRKDKILIDCYN